MTDQLVSLKAFVQTLRVKLQTHAVRMPMRGNSMIPTIRPGQKVVITRKAPGEIKPRDIALFVADERIILHRIIYKENIDGMMMFLTRGDNCDALDDWVVDENAILGVSVAATCDGSLLEISSR